MGSVITGLWTSCREKNRRRSDFRGFLQRWKSRITAQNRGPDIVRVVLDSAILAYDAGLPDFRDWVERVRRDFKGCHGFETLTVEIGNLKREDWQKCKPREVITEAIDELVTFLA
jgi:hypothetical protein